MLTPAERAIEQIVLFVLQANTQLGREDAHIMCAAPSTCSSSFNVLAGKRRVAEVIPSSTERANANRSCDEYLEPEPSVRMSQASSPD
jgi:hypothetical protein